MTACTCNGLGFVPAAHGKGGFERCSCAIGKGYAYATATLDAQGHIDHVPAGATPVLGPQVTCSRGV